MKQKLFILKKLLIVLGKTFVFTIEFFVFYFTVAFIFSSISFQSEIDTPQDIGIYILSNGVHTDIVVPTKTDLIDWSKEIKFNHTKKADSTYNYIGMGWGDKGFYLETPTWAELKYSVAFKAAFGLSSTAIHTTYHKDLKENEKCKKLAISKKQYKKLINYISKSFQKDEDGHFIQITTDANYCNTDAFYEATGKYSLVKTCNTWANNGLKACGQKCCFWTPFDSGIFSHYKD